MSYIESVIIEAVTKQCRQLATALCAVGTIASSEAHTAAVHTKLQRECYRWRWLVARVHQEARMWSVGHKGSVAGGLARGATVDCAAKVERAVGLKH